MAYMEQLRRDNGLSTYKWMQIIEDTSQWCPSVLEISQVSQIKNFCSDH